MLTNVRYSQFRLAVIQAFTLFALHIIFGITALFGISGAEAEMKREMVYLACYAWMFIYILLFIRKMIQENRLRSILRWIIRLEALKAISGIAATAGMTICTIISTSATVVLVVLYIYITVLFFNKSYRTDEVAVSSRYFFLALTISFILAIAGSALYVSDPSPVVFSLIYLVLAFPFLFLIKLLYSLKRFMHII